VTDVEINTFSIAARCARTGMLGVAVSTAVPGVGSIVTHARPEVGAIATQSWANPYLGPDGLDLLEQGLGAEEALEKLMAEDPGRETRQIGVVDAKGGSAAFTGADCTTWFGHTTGQDYAAQGNMLVNAETVDALAETFEANADDELPERLMKCLEAAQAAGGDKRGRQSAALYVVKTEAYPLVDLRVDEHTEPVAELRRVFTVASKQLRPFVEMMPTRAEPTRNPDDALMQIILLPPVERPR
jgi:uncharacterized Ntn-hydrolase superfamily protein